MKVPVISLTSIVEQDSYHFEPELLSINVTVLCRFLERRWPKYGIITEYKEGLKSLVNGAIHRIEYTSINWDFRRVWTIFYSGAQWRLSRCSKSYIVIKIYFVKRRKKLERLLTYSIAILRIEITCRLMIWTNHLIHNAVCFVTWSWVDEWTFF